MIPTKAISLILATIIISACGGGSGGSSASSISESASLTMSASPSSVENGESSSISWTTENSVSCKAEGNWHSNSSTSGNAVVGPLTKTTSYTMSCLGNQGGQIIESVTVTVNEPKTPVSRPTLSLTADAIEIDKGKASTLRWRTTNARSCVATGGWTTQTGTSGNHSTGSLNQTTTYSMTCSGNGGVVSDSVTISIKTNSPTPSPSKPSLTLSADKTTIQENNTTIIRWEAKNADSCSAVGSWTSQTGITGSRTVGPLIQTTNYSMNCTGKGGISSDSVTITVTPATLGSTELSWTPPNTNADGSTPIDLASYKIYYGTSQNSLDNVVNINNSGITTFVLDNLPSATYYFSVTALDANGNESERSNIASKVIN